MRKHGREQPLLPQVSISCLKDPRVPHIDLEDFAGEEDLRSVATSLRLFALMLCSRLQMNPRLTGLKAERLGRTAASAVASAPNQLASVAAN